MTEVRGWLLQRLRRPPRTDWDSRIDRALSFGGGGSGLSKEAWDILHKLFSFDYMGSAEYEFGAVPKMLEQFLKDRKQLVASKFELKRSVCAPNTHRRWHVKKSKDLPDLPTKDVPIFVICRDGAQQAITDLVGKMAKDEHRAKEYTSFLSAIDPIEEWDENTRGWMDLTDGFFIFIDEEMWKRTCETLEVKLP
jgi:hypothetical protein